MPVDWKYAMPVSRLGLIRLLMLLDPRGYGGLVT
jgi:hypothetical protein